MSNVKKHVSTINPVGAVLDVGSADEVQWSDASDVVVVGWGGAGASAAIHAGLFQCQPFWAPFI